MVDGDMKVAAQLASDQLKAAEIRLVETTLGEAKAAKACLDAHRKKRRERHGKKKQPH